MQQGIALSLCMVGVIMEFHLKLKVFLEKGDSYRLSYMAGKRHGYATKSLLYCHSLRNSND